MKEVKYSLLRLGVMSGVILLATVSGCRRPAPDAEKVENKDPAQSEEHHSEPGVHLEQEKQERMGLQVQSLAAVSSHSNVELYGVLESDPAESFVVRAPFAGVLHSGQTQWPAVGSQFGDRSTIASISPLLPAVDRLTITDRLSTIRADVTASAASLDADRAEYQRIKTLNAEDKNVSDKTLEEAEARLKGEQARLESARRSQDLYERALNVSGKAPTATPLIAERGGQVVEVLAQPGESVEAGQPVVRLSRFNKLIAKLSLPLSLRVQLPIRSATIAAVGDEKNATVANFITQAPTAQGEYQSQTLLFQVTSSTTGLRAGQAIEGWVATSPTAAQSGVVIPSQAVVQYQGQNWIYVQVKPEQFARKPISLSDPQGGGWFVIQGVKPGDHVVVAGAQTLLSEEMKSQLTADED